MKKKLRCCKCFITLERLSKEGLSEYLIKIIKPDESEDYVCPFCNQGW